MRRFLLVCITLILITIPINDAYAQAQSSVSANDAGDYYDLPLCLPGMPADGTCLLYGPAQVVAEMKASGFSYPRRALPASTPPSELGVMPVAVAKINLPDEQPAPIYGSFEDAVAAVNPVRYIDPGTLRFVSYINRRDDANGRPYVQLTTGEWTRAAPAAYSRFQGLEFFEHPQNNFGWTVDFADSYVAPSFGAQTTGTTYYPYSLVQVYDSVEADGVLWYQINPNEWINSLKTRVVILRPTHPEGIQANRWIEIDLFQQTIMAYEDGQLRFATVTTTGMEPFYTQPGVFTIYKKKPLETMQGAFEADRSDFYYLEDVPWTMYYDEARAIHAAYWRTSYGYPGSHGCVNLSPGDAQWLFQWADEGDYVWVHDTSGRTPTDPNYYGPGAP